MFEPGHKKIGGRKKGSINKASLPIKELCAFHNCSPIEVLIKLTLDESDDNKGFRFQAAKELMPYLYPKLSATTMTVDMELAKRAEEYSKMSKEEQIVAMEEELKKLKEG